MISTKIDIIAEKSPAFAKYFRQELDAIFATSFYENAALAVFTALAASLLCGSNNDILRYGSLIVMAAAWISVSVLSGFLRQWVWPVFSAVWLMLPHLLYLVPDSLAEEQASDMQRILSRISSELLLKPIYEISFGYDAMTVSIVVFVVCFILFMFGNRVRAKARRSDLYCKSRIDQLK